MKKTMIMCTILLGVMGVVYLARAFDSQRIWSGVVKGDGVFDEAVVRIYDNENNVLCYVYQSGNTNNGGISCFKK